MFDKLGIVTNCLSKRMANKDSFEKLIIDFHRRLQTNPEVEFSLNTGRPISPFRMPFRVEKTS